MILGRHPACRPQDPTLDISSDFVKKKKEKHFTSYFSFASFLDRHHAWRSLDPTLDISSDFVKEAFCLHFSSFASLLVQTFCCISSNSI